MADDSRWMEKAFSKNKGGLHRATHTPQGEKIPAYKVTRAANSDSEHVRKMAQAAENARKTRQPYK